MFRSGTFGALLLAGAVAAQSGQALAQAALASFVVVHGIPGRDVGPAIDPLLPVDVLVNGKLCLLQNLTFGSIAGPFDVPAGTYTVAISLANPIAPCSNSAVINASVKLAAGEFGSIVAAVSTSGAPTAEVYPVSVTPVGTGKQRFITAHAADAPAVKVIAVSTGSGSKERLAFNLSPGAENTSVVPAREGFSIKAEAGSAVIGPVKITLGDQAVALLYAVGSAKTGSATILSKILPSVF